MRQLSKLEIEAATLASRGLMNKEIAWELGRSESYVKVLLFKVGRKIGTKGTRAELAVYWIRWMGCISS